jgi:CDP-glucose 4,6-dehydratase
MEGVVVNTEFWRGKRVLLTGHTGFKGSWLSLWLQKCGAVVTGYALPPPPEVESLFELASVGDQMESVFADIRNLEKLQGVMDRVDPEIVFHMAAQPIVRLSYDIPVETFHVNVMGTVHLLEAVRTSKSCRAVVVITSDKCYENREWVWGYRESEPMGGFEPYSASKGCAELVTASYRRSFFESGKSRFIAVGSARAGNVIGGGDFAPYRIVPDLMAAIRKRAPLKVRSPYAIRPWQHVLEPLSGYLLLAEKLWESPKDYAQGWNFGPSLEDTRPVQWIVEKLIELWGGDVTWELDGKPAPHEAHFLTLDSSKARMSLGWKPRWNLEGALKAVVGWNKAYERHEPLRDVVMQQIAAYEALET